MSTLNSPAIAPAAPIGSTHLRRARYHATGFIFGTVVFAAGGGVGIPYARKAGLTVTTVLGLACAFAGLALAAWSARRLAGRVSRWWKVPLVIGLVGFVLLVVSTLGIAVAATNVPPTALGPSTPGTPADSPQPASNGTDESRPSSRALSASTHHGTDRFRSRPAPPPAADDFALDMRTKTTSTSGRNLHHVRE